MGKAFRPDPSIDRWFSLQKFEDKCSKVSCSKETLRWYAAMDEARRGFELPADVSVVTIIETILLAYGLRPCIDNLPGRYFNRDWIKPWEKLARAKTRPGILWKGQSEFYKSDSVFQSDARLDIIAYATGTEASSENSKTGKMQQLFVLPFGSSPITASRDLSDESICGHCPYRPSESGACYVVVSQAPITIYLTMLRGRELAVGPGLVDQKVPMRLGAYGDPAMLPFDALERIAQSVDLTTGYTHQWRWCDPAYAKYCMASCDLDEIDEAEALGYRCFVVVPSGTTMDEGLEESGYLVQCKSTKSGKKCEECMLCSGVRWGKPVDKRREKRHIWIEAHGRGATIIK